MAAPLPVRSRRRWWPVLVLVGLTACGGGDSGGTGVSPPARGDLVSDSLTASYSVANVDTAIALLALLGVDTTGLSGKYGVSLRRVVYKTVTPDGRLIDASGMLAYPHKLGGAPGPLLSFQHGTIFRDADAPSNTAGSDAALLVLAGIGYIIALPDYIGYGASSGEVHPYVHSQGLAAPVVDMLRATRRLLAREGVATNGQLFLTGYSEGGYATLAAQKEMEQNLAGEFPLTASLPAAGPYDLSATAQYMIGLATNPYPQVVGFVFKAYDHWYQWNRLATIFQPPYDTVVDTYYDGNHGSSAIKDALTTTMADLFTPAFRADFLGSGETTVKAGFAANDLYHWAPATPTRLFHGVDDDIVPYFNATTARDAMNAAGAADLALLDCNTGDLLIPRGHEQCVPDYLTRVFGWFGSLATDL
jgi:predicted esterase